MGLLREASKRDSTSEVQMLMSVWTKRRLGLHLLLRIRLLQMRLIANKSSSKRENNNNNSKGSTRNNRSRDLHGILRHERSPFPTNASANPSHPPPCPPCPPYPPQLLPPLRCQQRAFEVVLELELVEVLSVLEEPR